MKVCLVDFLMRVGSDMGDCCFFEVGFKFSTLGSGIVSCRGTLGSGAWIALGTLDSDAGVDDLVDVGCGSG